MKAKFVMGIITCCSMYFQGYSQTDLPQHYELTGQAYIQADSLLDYWMKEKFPDILWRNKIKMSCASCTNVYMEVTMNIDEEGTWYGVNVLKSDICGKEIWWDLKIDFIYYFATMKFPPSLRGKKFIYRLGTGLTC